MIPTFTPDSMRAKARELREDGSWTEAADMLDAAADQLARREWQDGPETALGAVVDQGVLHIHIGIHRLAGAAVLSNWANPYNEATQDYLRSFAISDAEQFAKDVRTAMLNEAEDGSSPLTRFLDQVSEEAVNQGSLGLDENEHSLAFERHAPCETWALPPAPTEAG